jgi:hypothetical protein
MEKLDNTQEVMDSVSKEMENLKTQKEMLEINPL